jgi:hypothetical protein
VLGRRFTKLAVLPVKLYNTGSVIISFSLKLLDVAMSPDNHAMLKDVGEMLLTVIDEGTVGASVLNVIYTGFETVDPPLLIAVTNTL